MLDTLRSVLRFRRFELDANKRRLATAANVDDLRRIAKRRLPGGVFDYIDGGAEDERTMRANGEAFGNYRFRPRCCATCRTIDTDHDVARPGGPAPARAGADRVHPHRRPAGRAGRRPSRRAGRLPYTLSTLSTRSIEEVAAANGDGRRWFQVYVWKDKGLVRDMVDRAAAAGYEALVITVDTAILGRRERDVRRGFEMPPKLGLGTIVDGAVPPVVDVEVRPCRSRSASPTSPRRPPQPINQTARRPSISPNVRDAVRRPLSWDDVEWFRSVWSGPIVIKGIQTVDDARIAADVGVDAIALSNHGGRQLDDAPAPLDLVAPVAEAVGGRVEIICDGGVRRGSDIVKAIALGATACMAGRAYLYGLAAAGELGVDKVLGLLADDVRRTMALLGVTRISELSPEYLEPIR